MPAPTAAPEPELEPPTLWARCQGFLVSPPTADQPLIDLVERRFAHSDKFVEPTMSAPAFRRFVTSSASRLAGESINARLPALPGKPMASMLSLIKTATRSSGPWEFERESQVAMTALTPISISIF